MGACGGVGAVVMHRGAGVSGFAQAGNVLDGVAGAGRDDQRVEGDIGGIGQRHGALLRVDAFNRAGDGADAG